MWQQARPRLAPLQAAHARVVQAEQFTRQQAREALPTPTVGVTRVRGAEWYRYNQWAFPSNCRCSTARRSDRARAAEHAQALLEEDAAQQQARTELQHALNQRICCASRSRASSRAA